MIAIQRNRALGRAVYRPTATDIRRACEKIQATWSPRERAIRNARPRVARWTPPTVGLSGLVEAINEERADRATYFGPAENET
jgi:hypothetical protein